MNALSFLEASGPYPEYAARLMLYGQFVGSWRVASTWLEPSGLTRQAQGEWHFGWILGGRAIQDVLFRVGAARDSYGTSVRCYDLARDVWHIAWMQPSGAEFVQLVGRQIGDRIVQEGRSVDSKRLERWSFTQITSSSFVWLGEVSLDQGLSWRLEQKMEATRYKI